MNVKKTKTVLEIFYIFKKLNLVKIHLNVCFNVFFKQN